MQSLQNDILLMLLKNIYTFFICCTLGEVKFGLSRKATTKGLD